MINKKSWLVFSCIQYRIICTCLCVSLLFFPVRKAEAILPLVAIGVSAVTTTGITITAADVVGLGIAAAGMGALLYMQLTAPDGSSVAIPAQDAALHSAAIIPPPAAVATVASTPTYTYSYTTSSFGGYYGTSTVSAAAACSSLVGGAYHLCYSSETVCRLGQNAYGSTECTIGVINGTVSSTSTLVSSTCPSGYTLVAGTCNLSNSNAVIPDGRQDFTRNGAVYSPVTGDLVGSFSAVQGTTSTSGDSISFVGTNAGNVSTLTSNAQPGGGTTITQSTQLTDASGATYIRIGTIVLGSDGSIVSSSTVNVMGSLDTGAAASNGGAVVVSAPAGTIAASPVTPAASDPIVFPTDYARAGEASAAAVPIVQALAPLTTTQTVADPTLPVDADMPSWGNTFSGLLSWQLPGHSSVCPQPSVDLSAVLGAGAVYTLSSHCTLFNNAAVSIHSAMLAVWTIAALFIVLAA